MNCVTSAQAILIVDDSDDDYDTTVRALKTGTTLKNPIYRCEDGEDVLDYLFRRGSYTDPASAPRPGIIILDLNMPGTDGRRVLTEIKNDADLKSIPTIVMTNSDDERDITACYKLGANTYMRKLLDWPHFLKAMTRLREYWFEIAVLPKS